MVEDLTMNEELIGYYDYEEVLKVGFVQGARQNVIGVAKKTFGIPNIIVEQIAECTSLSLEEIEKMKEENNELIKHFKIRRCFYAYYFL